MGYHQRKSQLSTILSKGMSGFLQLYMHHPQLVSLSASGRFALVFSFPRQTNMIQPPADDTLKVFFFKKNKLKKNKKLVHDLERFVLVPYDFCKHPQHSLYVQLTASQKYPDSFNGVRKQHGNHFSNLQTPSEKPKYRLYYRN